MISNGYRYTDQNYSTKEQLAQQLPSVILDSVYREIEEYRKLFRLFLPDTSFFLTLSSGIYQKMQYVQTLWYMRKDIGTDSFIRKINSQSLDLYGKMKEVMIQKKYQLTEEQLLFLSDDYIPVLVRYFTCYKYKTEDIATLLALHYQLSDLNIRPDENTENDQTLSFIHYLQNSCDTMKKSRKTNHKVLEENTLRLRYPDLRKKQITFYLTHRETGEFYTLEDYRNYCITSYETARYSMDQLVQLGWYQKEKKGKKYIYYV